MDKEEIRAKHRDQLTTAIGILGIAIGICALTYNWIDAEVELTSCRTGLKAANAVIQKCADCGNDLHTLEQRIEFTADLVHECEDHIEIYRRSYLRADWKATKPELKKAIRGIICEGSP